MTFDTTLLLAFLTWPPCLGIAFIAICRNNAMQDGVMFRVGVEYALWIAIAFGIPLLPLIGEWPGIGMVALAWTLLVILLCSARAWKGDRAPDEATDHGALHPPLPKPKE